MKGATDVLITEATYFKKREGLGSPPWLFTKYPSVLLTSEKIKIHFSKPQKYGSLFAKHEETTHYIYVILFFCYCSAFDHPMKRHLKGVRQLRRILGKTEVRGENPPRLRGSDKINPKTYLDIPKPNFLSSIP